ATESGGGWFAFDTTAGWVPVAAPILASAFLGGVGGFVDVTAAIDLGFTASGQIAAVTGSVLGGEIDLAAPGALSMVNGSQLDASALNDSGGDGGEINLEGGSVSIQGVVSADGGGDPTGDIGGSGGSVA